MTDSIDPDREADRIVDVARLLKGCGWNTVGVVLAKVPDDIGSAEPSDAAPLIAGIDMAGYRIDGASITVDGVTIALHQVGPDLWETEALSGPIRADATIVVHPIRQAGKTDALERITSLSLLYEIEALDRASRPPRAPPDYLKHDPTKTHRRRRNRR